MVSGPFFIPAMIPCTVSSPAPRRATSIRSTLLSLILPLAAAVATLLPVSVRAQSNQQSTPVFSSLQAFTGGSSGAGPYGSLAQGPDGNFYGTTYVGGGSNLGTVFSVTSAGVITTLHSFTGNDGSFPQGGLVLADDGFIYGTTYTGGSNGDGTIFRVQPGSGAFQSLYSFGGVTDGANPYAGLVQINGLLYGSTVTGGGNDDGTLFSFSPQVSGAPLSVLHEFTGLSDGSNPQAAPISGGDGSLYGTAATGGDYQGGTVYRYTPGQGLTTLHAFSLGEPTGPAANLLLASDGNFYGTTILGGSSNNGAIFSLTPAGSLTTFYSFSGGTDGATPQSALIQSAGGVFYGTAADGGAGGAGTVFSITQTGIFSVLHAFASGADGDLPQSGLIQAGSGSLYGTTYIGGNGFANNGNGTVYRLTFSGTAGTVQFSALTYNTTESSGTANVTVSRVNGNSGAISVGYASADGTAVNGTDYTSVTGSLVWADGDVADKIIPVPILDRGIFDGSSKTVNLTLTSFDNGAVGGTPTTATLTIVDNDQQSIQPTIVITSPPADIQVVTGTPLSLAASVDDPNSILTQVQFFLNGALYSTSTGSGPFTLSATAPAPGTYVLSATATDNLGRQSTSTRTVTVVAAAMTDPAPTAAIITDLDGRTLLAGTTFVISANAESLNLNGEPLAGVDFYADNTLIASLDGQGNPDTSGTSAAQRARASAYRRTAANGGSGSSAAPTIFTANYTMPNLNKLINLLTVANTLGGRSQVSSSVTIRATNSTTDQAPRVALQNIATGARIRVGSKVTVPVAVSDPDASGSSAWIPVVGRRTADITQPSGIISKVEYYLNQLKVATSTAPPYTFDVAPPSAGTYLVEAIVTDGAGVSNVAAPAIVTAFATPTVTLTVGDGTTNKVTVTEGGKVNAIVTRDTDLADPLTVTYKVSGPNVAGVDYKTLSGSVVIPANSATAKIKVTSLNDGVADGDKTLKIKLLPAADGSYNLGDAAKVKITILDAQ